MTTYEHALELADQDRALLSVLRAALLSLSTTRNGEMAEPTWIEHDGSTVCPVPAGHDVEVRFTDQNTERDCTPEGWAWERVTYRRSITHYRDWTAWEQQQQQASAERQKNPPAFPTNYLDDGMTLRDWFAGQALATCRLADDQSQAEWVAARAYQFADAMLRARLPGLDALARNAATGEG